MGNRWQISIDTGGTFTDCIGISPSGKSVRCKILSNSALRSEVAEIIDSCTIKVHSNWNLPTDFFNEFGLHSTSCDMKDITVKHFNASAQHVHFSKPTHLSVGDIIEFRSTEEPPVLGIRFLTQTASSAELPDVSLKLATTRGTNALLENKTANPLFIVTKGFKDLLVIGDQTRPDLFALGIPPKKQLYEQVIEVEERIDSNGNILTPLQIDTIRLKLEKYDRLQTEVVTICLLNAYQNPCHEKELQHICNEIGFRNVITSTDLSNRIKYQLRAETCVVNAALHPIMQQYLGNIRISLKNRDFQVMTSSGGMVIDKKYRPYESLLSGPAGGVVGAAKAGISAGQKHIIAFDMGGTSTDVSRYNNAYVYQQTHRVGDATIASPSLKIETIAAGGGSICGINEQGLFVGPESAGASPGPACYGSGGPLSITDIHLLLGRLSDHCFGIPIHKEHSEKALAGIITELKKQNRHTNKEELLDGFLKIANEMMADAIRKISIQDGYDPTEFALLAFGGAGGMHACAIADILAINTILFPNDSGLLSANGLTHSRLEQFVEKEILECYSAIKTELHQIVSEMEQQAIQKLISGHQTNITANISRKTAQIRFKGQDSFLSIDFSTVSEIESCFLNEYQKVFGYVPENTELELVSVQIIASENYTNLNEELFIQSNVNLSCIGKQSAWVNGKWHEIPVYKRDELKTGSHTMGPCLIIDQFSTLTVESGWQFEIGSGKSVRLTKIQKHTEFCKPETVATDELFTQRFRNLVEEMGLQLQRTAISTNIRERLDFSCGLLNAQGELMVNAPHIPVHLGALGECVRKVAKHLTISPDDVIITNHPGFGGSHLPDVTVITPVFTKENKLFGYVANRAHHSELGGIRPGSMPPEAKNLYEEGIVISPTWLIKNGKSHFDKLEQKLLSGQYPTRSIRDNMADIRAQVAANRLGVERLYELFNQYDYSLITNQLGKIAQRSEASLKKILANFDGFDGTAKEKLDDGTQIEVALSVKDGRVSIDFQGTSRKQDGNLYATQAIIKSAIMYVLRLWTGGNLPLNEGLLRLVDLHLPTCFLNPNFNSDPKKCPPVVGGNVETSQRVVDTLIKAIGLMACSQGTMNNLIFGDNEFGYYETICGGTGAGDGFPGRSAVHSHMTNTAITDPEVLEFRYPVRLDRFEVLQNSGGTGKYDGGNGVIREFTFLKDLSLSVLTQHRTYAPYGLNGGNDGCRGRQTLKQNNQKPVTLDSCCSRNVKNGDKLTIETPGGGGWGRTDDSHKTI